MRLLTVSRLCIRPFQDRLNDGRVSLTGLRIDASVLVLPLTHEAVRNRIEEPPQQAAPAKSWSICQGPDHLRLRRQDHGEGGIVDILCGPPDAIDAERIASTTTQVHVEIEP